MIQNVFEVTVAHCISENVITSQIEKIVPVRNYRLQPLVLNSCTIHAYNNTLVTETFNTAFIQ